jgi:hypothetical protein
MEVLMPLQATSGAASYDAFGGGVAVVPNYIEDVFSTWLYTGNGSTQTINNGIDLAGKGGLVWSKARSTSLSNFLCDTVRGRAFYLYSNNTFNQAGPSSAGNDITAFNSNGYSLGPNQNADINNGSATFVSWTFREQPKFFDVVTYTGNGQNNRQIAHNLGSVPGCIMVKRTNASSDWYVYHRGLNGGTNPQNYYILLNSTAAQGTYEVWENTAPTSTVFTVDEFSSVNGSGDTFVAYLFAHNAGGFGLTGTDNVISCGSFTTDGSGNATIDLGYEPQWVLTKNTATGSWVINDVMRGMPSTPTSGEPPTSQVIYPNLSNAEASSIYFSTQPTPTGFKVENYANASFSGTPVTAIYIAIRRGPMKVPTSGTSVFTPIARTGTGSATTIGSTGFPVDSIIYTLRSGGLGTSWQDRLRGPSAWFQTFDTAAESTVTTQVTSFANQDSVNIGAGSYINFNGSTYINYAMRRAPGFFDEVCYSGVNAVQNVSHNLGVAPELMIVKRRNGAASWFVYAAPLGATKYLILNTTAASDTGTLYWNDTAPTSSVFTLANNTAVNAVNNTYVAYLFASCPGVSKCLAFTGTGTLQTINCGFTSGARFVLIKRTDSTGDWYVWDSSRGLSSSNDPYLLLNSTAAEVTSTNWVDTTSTGFQVTAASGNNVNINGASYIALAIS